MITLLFLPLLWLDLKISDSHKKIEKKCKVIRNVRIEISKKRKRDEERKGNETQNEKEERTLGRDSNFLLITRIADKKCSCELTHLLTPKHFHP